MIYCASLSLILIILEDLFEQLGIIFHDEAERERLRVGGVRRQFDRPVVFIVINFI